MPHIPPYPMLIEIIGAPGAGKELAADLLDVLHERGISARQPRATAPLAESRGLPLGPEQDLDTTRWLIGAGLAAQVTAERERTLHGPARVVVSRSTGWGALAHWLAAEDLRTGRTPPHSRYADLARLVVAACQRDLVLLLPHDEPRGEDAAAERRHQFALRVDWYLHRLIDEEGITAVHLPLPMEAARASAVERVLDLCREPAL
ncbi:hypothetical protein [Streptomyces sp. SPB78]|uniref:hypothetical protein n=1 Tax=Streptomyces sp. (strain SPB78) TaxID=591157 RepID=UPI0001B5431E|nr:hypothetical protein [Streptomyces sp. SPB78]